MKHLHLSLFLIIFASCSHLAPVQMGKGHSSNKQVKSCTHNILTFPANASANTISDILNRYKISSEEVYTIEKSYWYYLWPLYSNNCTIVNLNTNFSRELPVLKSNKKRKGEDANYKGIRDIKKCDELGRLSRSDCIKTLR